MRRIALAGRRLVESQKPRSGSRKALGRGGLGR